MAQRIAGIAFLTVDGDQLALLNVIGTSQFEQKKDLHSFSTPLQGALVWSGWPLLAYWKPRAFAGCVGLAFLKLWTSPGISAYASPALKVCVGFPSTS